MSLRSPGHLIRTLIPFAASLSLLATILSCAPLANSRNSIDGSPKDAPDFSLLDSNGTTLKLSDYRGKVVLLDFWATWCHGCRTEIPWYMEFQNKYKDKGLSVIGVSMDTGWNAVKPFMVKEKMNYPVVIGNDGLLERYGSHSMPATYLIDREGRIANYHIGVVNKDQFESEIKKLLAEKAS